MVLSYLYNPLAGFVLFESPSYNYLVIINHYFVEVSTIYMLIAE